MNRMRTGMLTLIVALSAACLFGKNITYADGLAPEDLSEQALIRRDTFGVPHILADTEEAAAYAYGYTAAEDHVLNIARLMIKARGEEAKYFGEEFVASDTLTKTLKMYAVAEAGYAKTAPWFRRILDGYAAGFNHYIEENRIELPEWVQPITGVDVMAHGRRVMIMEFCMNLRQIEAVKKKTQTASLEPAPAYMETQAGSNMWAIAPERSETGKALLLGNPHLLWAGSMLWHEVHLTVPDEINMYGATLIGFPGPGVGFNDTLGWSHTVNLHDCDDLYELTLNPDDPAEYLYEGRPVAMTREPLTVEVKTDEGVSAVREDVWRTHYGPIVHMANGKAYAYKCCNIDEYRFLEQWYLMTKARNLDEFRRRLDMLAIPMMNICYADVEGNIFYIFNGRFPDRPQGYDWSGVVPGGTEDTEWTTVLPQRRLPLLVNPDGGYVQNCNSAPWYTNLNAIIDRTEYPADLTPNFNSLRTQHSLKLIQSEEKMTLDEIKKYKHSYKLLLADRVKDDVIAAARGKTVDGLELDAACDVLEAWDNTARADSVGGVLFVQFWLAYEKLAGDEAFATAWDESKPMHGPRGIADEDAATKALAMAAKELKATAGTLEVPWGAVFRMRRGDLDLPMSGFIGDFGAFRVIGYREAADGKMVALGGDSFVFAVEFGDTPEASSILAYSQSDDPDSPHYADQTAMFARGEWKPVWFTEEDIKANTRRAYRP